MTSSSPCLCAAAAGSTVPHARIAGSSFGVAPAKSKRLANFELPAASLATALETTRPAQSGGLGIRVLPLAASECDAVYRERDLDLGRQYDVAAVLAVLESRRSARSVLISMTSAPERGLLYRKSRGSAPSSKIPTVHTSRTTTRRARTEAAERAGQW